MEGEEGIDRSSGRCNSERVRRGPCPSRSAGGARARVRTLLLRSARPRRRPSPHGSGLIRRRDRSRARAAGSWGHRPWPPLHPQVIIPHPWDPSPLAHGPSTTLSLSLWCVPHAGERTAALVLSLAMGQTRRLLFPFPASAMVKAGCLP